MNVGTFEVEDSRGEELKNKVIAAQEKVEKLRAEVTEAIEARNEAQQDLADYLKSKQTATFRFEFTPPLDCTLSQTFTHIQTLAQMQDWAAQQLGFAKKNKKQVNLAVSGGDLLTDENKKGAGGKKIGSLLKCSKIFEGASIIVTKD